MTTDTSRAPQLGGRKDTLTGNEPGLPRLHQLNLEEMHTREVISLLDTNQMLLLTCEFIQRAIYKDGELTTVDYRVVDAFEVLMRYAENRATNYELRKAKDGIRFIDGQVASAVWSTCGGDKSTRLNLQDALYDLALYMNNTYIWRSYVKKVRNQQKARAIEYLTGRAK